MPGNTVKINNSDDLEWYVGDSKMEQVIALLDEVGIREKQEEEKDKSDSKPPSSSS